MKLSLRWLGRYVDLDGIEPRQVAADLTMSTAEVEGIEPYGSGLDALVVGHVVEREQHPNADKLSLCRVDLGTGEPSSIVCGAPNVAAGQKVAVVQPGATLPGGLKIKKSKIRGVESFGMICSEEEMALSDDSDGILELPADAPIGRPVPEVLDVADHVVEIDNKSVNHRPDLWGHYGIARELAAIYDRPLRPAYTPVELPTDGRTLGVAIDDLDACPRYTGLMIEGVRSMPSPDWMRYLLAAVGQRPINLLVDLTNFVMLAVGQPMHAFDPRHLEASGVGVRFARPGETLTTLDGEGRRLIDSDLLITSGDRPVALAGIMGGEGTMVVDDTTELFLESANFRASTVRRTSTRLGLRTEASSRFEKALDPTSAEEGVRCFLSMLAELCPGARAAGPLVDPSRWTYAPRSIELRRARLDLKLGVSVSDERVERILRGLEFGVEPTADGFRVSVPSYRATKDVTMEDDLIEEVGRMYRYDNIPERPLVSAVEVPPRDEELYLARQLVRNAATELGASEAYNYSFVPDAVVRACLADEHDYLRVSNPVAPELARMRRHVLPSLLASLPRNLKQYPEVRMVELGKGYHPERRDEHGLPHEVHEVVVAWTRRDGEHPYRELRSGIESLLSRAGYPVEMPERYSDSDAPWAHPSKTVALVRGGQGVGYLGHLHPRVAAGLKLPSTTAIACVDLRALLASGRDDKRYDPISPYPTQPVDVALLVPRDARVGDVSAFLRAVNPKIVTRVELFEVYVGENIPGDRKSLNFTVTLGSMDRTLSSKDEEKYLRRLRERASDVGAELRG